MDYTTPLFKRRRPLPLFPLGALAANPISVLPAVQPLQGATLAGCNPTAANSQSARSRPVSYLSMKRVTLIRMAVLLPMIAGMGYCRMEWFSGHSIACLALPPEG
jgi:hypothetical protein